MFRIDRNLNYPKISACFQKYIYKITNRTFQQIVEQYKWKMKISE
jgi:hypothetical protein